MNPIESFEKRILSINVEALAAIDGKLQAERKDPDFQPEPIELRDDLDPIGMDWEWLEAAVEETPSAARSAAIAVLSKNASESRSRRGLTPWAAVGTALAASLLIGAGILIGERAFRGGDWNAPSGKLEMLLASDAKLRVGPRH